MRGRAGGFSLIELLMAMAVMVTFSSALMSLILAGQSMARMQPEAADLSGAHALQTLGAGCSPAPGRPRPPGPSVGAPILPSPTAV